MKSVLLAFLLYVTTNLAAAADFPIMKLDQYRTLLDSVSLLRDARMSTDPADRRVLSALHTACIVFSDLLED
jgi:hypothetical protein